MHLAGILVFFLLLMAKLACPFCGTIVKGEHGLSLHSSWYCKKNEIHFDNLLQQRRELLRIAYTKTPRVLLTLDGQYSRRDQHPSRAVDRG